jgi:hypothetical protein
MEQCMKPHETKLKDGDYVLVDKAAWFSINGLSIRISAHSGGVGVCVYGNGDELEGLDSLWFWDEIEERQA